MPPAFATSCMRCHSYFRPSFGLSYMRRFSLPCMRCHPFCRPRFRHVMYAMPVVSQAQLRLAMYEMPSVFHAQLLLWYVCNAIRILDPAFAIVYVGHAIPTKQVKGMMICNIYIKNLIHIKYLIKGLNQLNCNGCAILVLFQVENVSVNENITILYISL